MLECAAFYSTLSAFPSITSIFSTTRIFDYVTHPSARQLSWNCLRLHIPASISRNNRTSWHYSDASSRPLVALRVVNVALRIFPIIASRVNDPYYNISIHVTVQVNSGRIPYCRENEISTRSFENCAVHSSRRGISINV